MKSSLVAWAAAGTLCATLLAGCRTYQTPATQTGDQVATANATGANATKYGEATTAVVAEDAQTFENIRATITVQQTQTVATARAAPRNISASGKDAVANQGKDLVLDGSASPTLSVPAAQFGALFPAKGSYRVRLTVIGTDGAQASDDFTVRAQ